MLRRRTLAFAAFGAAAAACRNAARADVVIRTGPDGTARVIGTNSVPGGFGIWRWAGSNWTQVDGGAVRIAVDGRGSPWVVNFEGRIYHRQNNGWVEIPGRAGTARAGCASMAVQSASRCAEPGSARATAPPDSGAQEN